MAIFKCKHKEIRIIDCKKNETTYTVACMKCGEYFKKLKAVGDEYKIGEVVKG